MTRSGSAGRSLLPTPSIFQRSCGKNLQVSRRRPVNECAYILWTKTPLSQKTITITGGNGFVGRILQSGLRKRGYEVVVFDKMRGPLVDFLRRRHLGTSTGLIAAASAASLRRLAH